MNKIDRYVQVIKNLTTQRPKQFSVQRKVISQYSGSHVDTAAITERGDLHIGSNGISQGNLQAFSNWLVDLLKEEEE